MALGLAKNQLFQKQAMLNIKLKGMKSRTTCKDIFSYLTSPNPFGGARGQKQLFFRNFIVIIMHITLVNVYVDLVVFTRIACTS